MNPVRYTQVPQEVLQNENFYIWRCQFISSLQVIVDISNLVCGLNIQVQQQVTAYRRQIVPERGVVMTNNRP